VITILLNYLSTEWGEAQSSYPGFEVKNSVGVIDEGIDIRGDGGYIILPPSNHFSGNQYAWINSPQTIQLANLPEWAIPIQKNHGPKDKVKWPGGKIYEGNRNDTLTRYAGFLRRMELEQGEIDSKLQEYNEAHCDPPLPREEVSRIAKSAGTWPIGEVIKKYPLTDLGNGERFSERYSQVIKFVPEWGWLYYNDSYWERNYEEIYM